MDEVEQNIVICWRSQRLRQNINWSARHWQITMFYDNWINDKLLFLSFDQWVCFFNEYLRLNEAICHFHARAVERRRKAWFHLRIISTILFAAKHSWMTLCMSRPLFVGSYLLVMWWVLGQWKGRKISIISYPTSASGIVLLKMPTKYQEFFPSLFIKTTDFQIQDG